MGQQTGSKLGKEYLKAVYCHPAYLTYMQSTSWQINGKSMETVTDFISLVSKIAAGIGLSWWLRRSRTRLQCGRSGFDLWVEKIPWKRERLLISVSGLENSVDRGSWQAAVHGVGKSQARLSDFHFPFGNHCRW